VKFKEIPTIYKVRALAENPEFLKLIHDSVLQWPKSNSLDAKTMELVGLAKSIAHNWEPGVLTNIEGAIEAGASEKELVEAILVTSSVLALADLDSALEVGDAQTQHNSMGKTPGIEKIVEEAREKFTQVPEFYSTQIARENPDWLKSVHGLAKVRYSKGVLDNKTKALICLATSAVKHWSEGVREYVQYALRSGATKKEIADVLLSTHKTAGVIGIQMGLGVPCSVPQMPGFRLIADHYRNRKTRG
jgi:alkylhydroperoxidase/carboxymuconolactone decarboxylase family protein YurZ